MCIFYRKKEKEKETNWHFLEFKFCKLTVIDGGEKGICCVFCFLEKKMVQNWLVKSGWNFVTMDKNYCNFFFFSFFGRVLLKTHPVLTFHLSQLFFSLTSFPILAIFLTWKKALVQNLFIVTKSFIIIVITISCWLVVLASIWLNYCHISII